jgi:hypothetical protein
VLQTLLEWPDADMLPTKHQLNRMKSKLYSIRATDHTATHATLYSKDRSTGKEIDLAIFPSRYLRYVQQLNYTIALHLNILNVLELHYANDLTTFFEGMYKNFVQGLRYHTDAMEDICTEFKKDPKATTYPVLNEWVFRECLNAHLMSDDDLIRVLAFMKKNDVPFGVDAFKYNDLIGKFSDNYLHMQT